MLLSQIHGLHICEDRPSPSIDCQSCINSTYPVHQPYRDKCMKTCHICTNVENVALNKPAYQKSTDHGGVASRGVDGSTNNNYDGKSCSHTSNKESTQWWCVDLGEIYNINHIRIYNRVSNSERLEGFELRAAPSGQCSEAGFSASSPCYRNQPPKTQSVYNVDRCNQGVYRPISAGSVFVVLRNEYLTICEFKTFTGTECSYGYYSSSSSSCEPCDGCSNNHCNPHTGICIGDCKPGFYGAKCQQTCNTHCKDGVCDGNGGRCSQGCILGYYGDQCNETCSLGCSTTGCNNDGSCFLCKTGFYGVKCEARCPSGCYNGCSKTSGTCGECREGAVGLFCDITCGGDCRTLTEEEKRWSVCEEDCKKDCKEECHGASCDVAVVRCNYSCIGGQKDGRCLNFKDKFSIPITSSIICLIVGLVIGAVVCGLIFWLCFMRRQRPREQQSETANQRTETQSRIQETNTSTAVIYGNRAFSSDSLNNTYASIDRTSIQKEKLENPYLSVGQSQL